MLNKLRNFSKTKLATVLVAIIIIPFVFWGMGGVFQGGTSNNIAKIKNVSISTQDFFEHVSSLGINEEIISKNIDNGIIKELLNDLLAKKFIELEIKKLGITLNDKNLIELIKNNKNFLDENENFNRIKYEKFLLENNISASEFEKRLKKRELEKILFDFYSAGLHVPKYLVDTLNYNENRSIDVEYVPLIDNYKKKDEFKKKDILNYLELNKENLKRDLIDVRYVKLTPEILTGTSEYNDDYYSKIDEIENDIFNKNNLNEILKNYVGLKISEIKGLSKKDADPELKEIFDYKESDQLQIIDKENYFLVFRNQNYRQEVPRLDEQFSSELKEILYKENKFKYNQDLFLKIQSKDFDDASFKGLVSDKNAYKKGKIKSIKDNNIFDINSVELIYSMPINSFLLVANEKEEIYLLKIIGANDSSNFNEKELFLKTKDNIKNEIYSSYDQYLNKNYKVEINYNTLERTKNYFK